MNNNNIISLDQWKKRKQTDEKLNTAEGFTAGSNKDKFMICLQNLTRNTTLSMEDIKISINPDQKPTLVVCAVKVNHYVPQF